MKELPDLIKEQQKARFGSLSRVQREEFLQSLINKDRLPPEVAQRVFDQFETGQAGSVAEALNNLKQQDTPSHYSDI